MLFADLSCYTMGLRKEIGIECSVEAGWQNYSQKFRCIMRLDGQAKDDVPATPISGADTLSSTLAIAHKLDFGHQAA